MADTKGDATPAPSEVEEETPQQADTGEATPQEGGESTPQTQTEEEGVTSSQKVAELQAEIERLRKEIEHARNMQSIADKKAREERKARLKLEKELKKIREGRVSEEEPLSTEPEEAVNKAIVKGRIAELLLRNPNYQKVVDQDPTLKEVLLTNPMALVEEAVDVEDAVEQIQEKIEKRLMDLEAQKPAAEKATEQKKIEAGAVQPPENRLPDEEVRRREALKKGNIEEAILARLKQR
ncbi:MAG: hypothetical protein DRP11_03590 [Candidatus Aenigmatarchaeota archaeon]|nr:MAG: hypothetical protein DRP11_03590 [Candidatus Aenigmarchaeota archaeon]